MKLYNISWPSHLGLVESGTIRVRVCNISTLPVDNVNVHILLGKSLVPVDNNPFVQMHTAADGSVNYGLLVPLQVAAQNHSGIEFRVRLHQSCQLFEVHTFGYAHQLCHQSLIPHTSVHLYLRSKRIEIKDCSLRVSPIYTPILDAPKSADALMFASEHLTRLDYMAW